MDIPTTSNRLYQLAVELDNIGYDLRRVLKGPSWIVGDSKLCKITLDQLQVASKSLKISSAKLDKVTQLLEQDSKVNKEMLERSFSVGGFKII